MRVGFIEIGQVNEENLKYAVISASFKGKWIYVKHKERDTWEIPGGRREIGEEINDTAKRELFEETGAKTFDIKPICEYSVTTDNKASYGRLYYAEVEELGDLPDLEIERIELFDTLPENLTYPEIQPLLYEKVVREKTREYLGKKVKVIMDRPLGAKHPKCKIIYPINYGYLPNTASGDGEEIDAYIIGEFEPLEFYEGYVVAIIRRTNDNEDKLVVCKDFNLYNQDQIRALTEFQERFFESDIIMYKKNEL